MLDESVPAALLNGVELSLPGVLADNVDAQVFQPDVLLRRQSQQQLVAQQVVVQRQLSQAMALVSHTEDTCHKRALCKGSHR